MIRFQVLGTVDLRDEVREVRAVLRRPKLLALLAYLGIARPFGFHRRDALVALLWPELDSAHARNALRQAVHALRQALGHEIVLARGEEELGTSGAHLWCDVREFETTLEAGEAERALELYQGELLHGLHVSGVPDFERWLDQEREHLRRRACEAAHALIARAEAEGNPAAAARWALRRTELSPYDETAARRLIGLLDRAGDRAGAVRAYGEFERRLERDLEVQPSVETRRFVEGIRADRQPKAFSAPNEAGAAQTDLQQPGPVPVRAGWRRVAAVLALFVGGVLTGAWFLSRAHLSPRSAETARGPKRLVVLPFANLGPVEDGYFADGVTEEITARLAAIGRLRVIAATRGNAYRNTRKTVPEIGRELGADYVLEGSVRWERPARGRARVRVIPQLVRASDGTHLWAEVYDEPLDEIFRVQSDVAQKVVGALDVRLLEPERRLMEAKPTSNLQAYDYYLRGSDFMHRGTEERFTRTALRMFEKAVELDSRFALAHAQLAQLHGRMYWFFYDRSEDRLAKARSAIDKAFALDSGLAEAHVALGFYFLARLQYDSALQEYDAAAASRPNDSYIYLGRAAVRNRQGNVRQALADFEKALQLDPAFPVLASSYAQDYDRLRDFAHAEPLYNRAIALSPDWFYPYFWKAGMYLRRDGATPRARAVLDEARSVGVADNPLIIYDRVLVDIFDREYDAAIRELSPIGPEIIQDQFRFIPRAQLAAQVYGLMQRHDRERAYYDSAQIVVLRRLREQPENPQLHSALGIAYAGLGRKREAIHEGEKAVQLLPVSKEAYRGYYRAWDLARIYTMVGEYDAAVTQLERLLSIPGHLTVAWLRIDPTWDSLRSHPRFRKLLSA